MGILLALIGTFYDDRDTKDDVALLLVFSKVLRSGPEGIRNDHDTRR
jgi:hypothetical protein